MHAGEVLRLGQGDSREVMLSLVWNRSVSEFIITLSPRVSDKMEAKSDETGP